MSDARARAWQAAGRAAAALVPDGGRVGLGTGRAAAAGIHALAERMGAGLRCVGVATSRASAELAAGLGIPLDDMRGPVDLAFDGADVVTPEGLVVKGAGGALVRERIVDDTARRFVVLVDAAKLAPSADAWGVLPVAVLPFATAFVAGALADLAPVARPAPTDDGLTLLDVRPPAGADWEALHARIRALPGVVDTGLFRVSPADVLVGAPDGGVATLAGRHAGDRRAP
ncbi:MAG TPA: ribose 5-phosphate isomerase A [Miltoncostaeaceae bacterium]|nr:ribose 5-phosphate isomerase A [Miltoncostaeaceae bacterium]